MKSTVIFGAILVFSAILANAQQPAPRHTTARESLRAAVGSLRSLGPDDRIAVTKTLPLAERESLIRAITSQFRQGNGIENADSEQEILEHVAATRVKLIDLSGDGIPEVIAQASDDEYCSPTGNCTFWVFLRSGDAYKLILERIATQSFSISPTRTGGFNDLVLAQHGSAFQSNLFVYRFASGRYRKTSCYEASWGKLLGDERRELKDPVITPCRPVGARKP